MNRPPSYVPLFLRESESKPWMVPHFSTHQSGVRPAVLVLPGGGYAGLADHEGAGYANFLNLLGVHAFVLHYRLGSEGNRHPDMLNDAALALRTLRMHAEDWGLVADKIAIMGSSAGGHLAASLVTLYEDGDPDSETEVERFSSRPDLGILAYPVISSNEAIYHGGSFKNLLGDSPTPELLHLLSLEHQVRPESPPCFVWHTLEDPAVPAENSIEFIRALRAQGVPFEFHLYEHGGHGIGIKNPHPWTADLQHWLACRGWL